MAGDVAALTDALHVERWASAFLGELWVRRDRVGYDDGWAAILGSPIVEDLAAVGGCGAKLALIALSRVDPTVFGVICGDLADELSGIRVPVWTEQIGAAEVTRAAWDRPPGCGELSILGLQRSQAESHSLLLCAAREPDDPIRYLAVCKPFDRVLEHFTPAPGEPPFVSLKPAEPAFICRQIEKTMRASDRAPTGNLGEGYVESRALVLAALRQVMRPRITRNGFSLDGSQIA
jgi:hypothetical protein